MKNFKYLSIMIVKTFFVVSLQHLSTLNFTVKR